MNSLIYQLTYRYALYCEVKFLRSLRNIEEVSRTASYRAVDSENILLNLIFLSLSPLTTYHKATNLEFIIYPCPCNEKLPEKKKIKAQFI